MDDSPAPPSVTEQTAIDKSIGPLERGALLMWLLLQQPLGWDELQALLGLVSKSQVFRAVAALERGIQRHGLPLVMRRQGKPALVWLEVREESTSPGSRHPQNPAPVTTEG